MRGAFIFALLLLLSFAASLAVASDNVAVNVDVTGASSAATIQGSGTIDAAVRCQKKTKPLLVSFLLSPSRCRVLRAIVALTAAPNALVSTVFCGGQSNLRIFSSAAARSSMRIR